MTKKQTLIVNLRRSGPYESWGISIAGGADLGTPIIVTRSENDLLRKGDVIKKIDEYDVRDIRHVDAQYFFHNTESLRLVIERQKSSQDPKILPKSPSAPTPVEEIDLRTFESRCFKPGHDHLDEIREERIYLSQPYRTTPLVLPGAKIKKDAPLGECYLRHHPNPAMRASPHQYDMPEVAMKQRVVHKQFNSPIGLYSDKNIADSIKCQASAVPGNSIKIPVVYDPSRSEAYKALREEEAFGEAAQDMRPAQTGVFSPNVSKQNKYYSRHVTSNYINALDDNADKIHQSNSFKRIMRSVLGTTDY